MADIIFKAIRDAKREQRDERIALIVWVVIIAAIIVAFKGWHYYKQKNLTPTFGPVIEEVAEVMDDCRSKGD